MNGPAILGLWMAAGTVLLGVSLGGSLEDFFDLTTAVLAVVVTAAVLVMTYGWNTAKTFGLGGFKRWMWPASAGKWSPQECMRAVRFAHSGGYIAMMVGGTCTFIGCIQMLQNMEDPTAIGPAISVAVLSLFYATALNLLLFLPMARHYKVQALEMGGLGGHGEDLDFPLTGGLLILFLTGLSIGLAFSVLLLSFASWG